MQITDEISTFLNKHITTSDVFSHLYLPAWVLASWLVLPGMPVLYITGKAREQMLDVLACLCSEVALVKESHGLCITPTIVTERPTWPTDSFTVRARKAGPKPDWDAKFRLSLALWAKRNAEEVQACFWGLLHGQKPDPLAGLTAVLLVDSLNLQEIAPTAWERRLTC